jgi:hypothetical protein
MKRILSTQDCERDQGGHLGVGFETKTVPLKKNWIVKGV